MELTFIISAVVIFSMIALRSLELRFERPIILAHVSWPLEKRLRVHFKKIPNVVERIHEYFASVKAGIRIRIIDAVARAREAGVEYIAELQESLRGKRALSRGSVSFFLLNISDYGNEKKKEAVSIPVEKEESI